MNLRLVKFSLCSLALHGTVFLWLWHPASFESGIAGETQDRPSALTVTLQNETRQPLQPPAAISAESAASFTSSGERQAPITPEAPQSSFNAENSNPVALDAFLPAGQLTRLPRPTSDIDLNVAEIDATGFVGKAELTLLIDTDGNVITVVLGDPDEASHAFSERVAERFKHVHFAPGEVDGKAVRSQLRIVVVSERLPTNDVTH